MRLSTVVIVLLLLIVGALLVYLYFAPPKLITIVERPVYDVNYVSWRPWAWGAGGWGWPGASYVNRPMPHFYGSHGGGWHPKFGAGGKPPMKPTPPAPPA
jgi:hypothetical protein